jgi:tetratricopeptide (TPR) repeat protein
MALGLGIVVSLLAGISPQDFLQDLRASHVLPIVNAPDRFQAYRLLSPLHLLDLANVMILVAPGALLAIPAVRWGATRQDRALVFLASAAVPALLVTALLNPEIGAFRDWDLLALPAVPVTLFVANGLIVAPRVPGTRRWVMASIAAACALHSAAWIGVNASAEAAERRFGNLLRAAPLSVHARAHGWETLGAYLAEIPGRAQDSAAALDQMLAADATNPRHWSLAALAHERAGDTESALRYAQKAISMQPAGNAKDYNNLGTMLSHLGRTREAISAFVAARTLEPKSTLVLRNLGLEFCRVGRHQEALPLFVEITRLQPEHPDAYFDAGTVLSLLSRDDEAVAFLQEGVRRRPEFALGHELLGDAEYRRGNLAGAALAWKQAMRLEPRNRDLESKLELLAREWTPESGPR